MGMIRTQVLLTPELRLEVEQLADELGISLSAAVRKVMDKGINLLKPKKKNPLQELLKMAENAPSYPEAPKDLASNDEYLYGKLAPDYPY